MFDRDFEAVRTMLADEVRLELVNKLQVRGSSKVAGYFDNDARLADWQLVPGSSTGDRSSSCAILETHLRTAQYLLQWAGDWVSHIRDFRYSQYVTEGAEESCREESCHLGV